MSGWRHTARVVACTIGLLLAAVWIVGALASLKSPLLDIGTLRTGNAIIAAARTLDLTPAGALKLAEFLTCAKLLVGVWLVVAVVVAIAGWAGRRGCDEAMLDVGLFLSAVATTISALPVLAIGGEPLQAVLGELILCAIARALADFAGAADAASGRPVTANRADPYHIRGISAG